MNRKTAMLLAAGLLFIVASGVVHGIQTDRWGKSQRLMEASQRLQNIPREFGDWRSEDREIPEEQLRVAEATGNLSRVYSNVVTGENVSVMILCGKPGPISVHPPTVCFVGAGWTLAGTPNVTQTPDERSQFWNGHFTGTSNGTPVAIDTLWGWSCDGRWIAYDNARLETAGNSFLYKMYVTVNRNIASESSSVGVANHFLEEFLPMVDASLFKEDPSSTKEVRVESAGHK